MHSPLLAVKQALDTSIMSECKEKPRLLCLTFSCKEERKMDAQPDWLLLPHEFFSRPSRLKVCSFAKWDSLGCTQVSLRLAFVFHEAAPKAESAGRHCHPPESASNFMQFLFLSFGLANLAQSWHKNSTLWHLMNKITPWPESAYTLGRIPKTSSCLCSTLFCGPTFRFSAHR